MTKSQNEAIEIFYEMKKGINNAGSIFCQYRACNLTVDTIYDLENIKNGVVYARSPLYMNDPFDSMIGFSTEKLYQDFCNMIVSIIPDQMTKVFMGIMLKEKAIGKVAEFISTIKAFQAFLRVHKNKMNPAGPSVSAFAISQRNVLFKKMSPALKKKIGNTQIFSAMALFTADVDLSMITEENLLQMFQVDSALITLLDKFEEVKEKHYIPQFKEFLSQITVSCFSASGWNNQLMWSHYANSYSGICVEYDFSTVNGTTGFVYPVEYSSERPTITLSDLGFSIAENGKLEWKAGETDTKAIMSYLLVKNKCWEYEQEWRIINIGEKNTPIFIDMPKIKSITLGLNVNNVCKHLLLDICKDKGIPCYNLVLDTEKFALDREPIDLENFVYDIDDESCYIQHLCEHIAGIGKKLEGLNGEEFFDKETQYFSATLFFNMLSQINDVLFYIYCLKKAVNSFMQYADDSVTEETFSDLRENAKSVDELTTQLNIQPLDALEGIKKLKMHGIINLDIYKRSVAMLQANNALQEKISTVIWDSRIQSEENDPS